MSSNKQTRICCICGGAFEGYGNNAEPIKTGICCDKCNNTHVMKARINQMFDHAEAAEAAAKAAKKD